MKMKTIVLEIIPILCVASIAVSQPLTDRTGKHIFEFHTNSQENSGNSPIYYFRMPPVPYSFIPGLGYISHPANASPSFVNLPLPFLGNGKPVTVYRWNGAFSQFPVTNNPNADANIPETSVFPEISQDSLIHRLKGQFEFNGKPNEVFLLKDSYNSIYDEDVLNNIYP